MTSYSFNYVFRDLILALKFQITEVLEIRNSNQAARPSQRGGGATVWARDYTWGVWQQAETVSPPLHRSNLNFVVNLSMTKQCDL